MLICEIAYRHYQMNTGKVAPVVKAVKVAGKELD
jgi:hypothetical protein